MIVVDFSDETTSNQANKQRAADRWCPRRNQHFTISSRHHPPGLIYIIEEDRTCCQGFGPGDDAQNGPDYVEHTPHSTAGVPHTIELIPGLPPRSQHDAAAVSCWRCFQ